MIIREFLGSANLTKAQTFYIYESTKVVMVRKDKNLKFVMF